LNEATKGLVALPKLEQRIFGWFGFDGEFDEEIFGGGNQER
jgi:hypothetical protein